MSDWYVSFSKKATKFLDKNHISENEVAATCVLAARKIAKEDVNVDLRKLNPPFQNSFRIRLGNMRITINNPDFLNLSIEIVNIEWRNTNSYK